MADISGRAVLVVGGAKGIGREICRLLAAKGARVLVADRDAAGLAALAGELPALRTRGLDMAAREDVAAFVAELGAAGERLDAVVMSAAVHGGCPIEAMSDEFIDTVVAVNLVAHVRLLRDLIPFLAEGGRIVGLSSNSAEIGIPMEGLYAATKAGMERVYEALAIELADRRIRPLLVQTGNVNTGFNETGNEFEPEGEGYLADSWRKVLDKVDSRNGIPPAEVAEAVVKLLAARKPPLRSLVGMNAVKTHWAVRTLGTERALGMVAKVFGLGRPG